VCKANIAAREHSIDWIIRTDLSARAFSRYPPFAIEEVDDKFEGKRRSYLGGNKPRRP
jgi:hypothetical protein